MVMPPRLRKLVLTAHVVSSVGWLGAVVTFVALAVIAMTSPDGQIIRGALLVMEPVGWYVLLPLASTSVVTGIIQGLGSTFGLIRHFWVVFKLVIGVVSTYVLLMFLLTTIGPVSSGAANPAAAADELRTLAGTPRDHALLALAGLVIATVLAVYKPRALTRYGQRRLDRQRGKQRAEVTVPALATGSGYTASDPERPDDLSRGTEAGRPGRLARWLKVVAFVVGVLVWAVLVRVVLGSGPGDGGASSPGPGGEPAGVSQQQDLERSGGHQPPAGVPQHGK